MIRLRLISRALRQYRELHDGPAALASIETCLDDYYGKQR